MATKSIDAVMISKMLLLGAANLEAKKEFINELNVFPVPDGDTGTNMTMTVMSAVKEVKSLDKLSMRSLAKAVSSGSLRGARGNSGVILSQLFRGFAKTIEDKSRVNAAVLSSALAKARDTAYKAVIKPKEGTILTVANDVAKKGAQMAAATDDLEQIFPALIKQAEETLAKTPDLLPVLKEAGVVDSGGQGLLEFLRGAYDAFCGKEIDYRKVGPEGVKRAGFSADANDDEIRFGYCTEFIINAEDEFDADTENGFKSYLQSIGDSIVCVVDDDLVKVHVHTNDPGLVLTKALTYGSLSRIKIDNMREEHREVLFKREERAADNAKNDKDADVSDPKNEGESAGSAVREAPLSGPRQRKDFGFIAVCAGSGLTEIFKGLGADYVIEGGQTMNPSTEDMLKAIDAVDAAHVFIFPNNKNITLTANQAASVTDGKDVSVIPTGSVPEGITAIMSFTPDLCAADNEAAMKESITRVRTAEVTYAVRDTSIGGKAIREGDIMGLCGDGISAVGDDPEKVAVEVIKSMCDKESELISIYYGEDVSKEKAEAVAREAERLYPDKDVDVQYGGQPVYYYVIAVE